MKDSKFTEAQITNSLKEYEAGNSVVDICRELKINGHTFYLWRKKYSGMDLFCASARNWSARMLP